MKKLIIVTIIAAFFAACNNTPATNESTTKAASLKTWVDSVKGLAVATTDFDSATWANWDATYNTEVAAINEADLDETNKATFATTKATWAEVATMYSAGITKEKEAAAAAAAMDTTKTATPVVPVEPKKEEAKK